jgi:hypothetical protein
MIADKLLQRLEKVKQTGKDRWLACCPAHNDKNPSLSIREVDDRLLVHCHAGCSNYEIVSAVGLELSDLFPENPDKVTGRKSLSKPFPAADILMALSSELTFLMICAGDMSKGEKLEGGDLERLRLAASRFKNALNMGGISA